MLHSPAFTRFYERHLTLVEGGVIDHPLDAGGATWYGISARFLALIGRTGPLTHAQARQVAYEHFWLNYGCEDMDEVAAWCYCDALFNHNPRTAHQLLQYALNVKVDGVVGPATRAAAREVHRGRFIERYRLKRIRYFVGIVQGKPSQIVFLVGWIDRINRLQQAMLLAGLFDAELDRRRHLARLDGLGR